MADHPQVHPSHRKIAKQFFDALQAEADVGMLHYAPDFRDSLGDNEHWVVMRLAELVARLQKANDRTAEQ